MLRSTFFILLLLFSNISQASDNRKDNVDLFHTHLELDISDFSSKTIAGFASIDFWILEDTVNSIKFDLLKFTVDSVIYDSSASLAFTYNDTVLNIDVSQTGMLKMQAHNIKIYYHGSPQKDPSGWGGWYWSGNYAFNLGVGFGSDPHNFGRAWFPCFDNFYERCTYSFGITTDSTKMAICNGLLQRSDSLAGKNYWKWKLESRIPSYLASVSVAPYQLIEEELNTLNNSKVPFTLGAAKGDTANARSSFRNMQGAMDAFENAFGKHRFERVGFNLVPFNSGAMEHATNISYPRYAVSGGGLDFETLMAHEFAHHWWGDYLTCESQEEMWLNEGMASYSEQLFLEQVYGVEEYKHAVADNHLDVLRMAHINDGEILAVKGIGHAHTYGDHVYNKGADMAHTLRGFMGDVDFFDGLKNYVQDRGDGNMNTLDFIVYLRIHTSNDDLMDFKEDFIEQAGFTFFTIDSFTTKANGSQYDISVHLRQKLRFATRMFNNVPLEILFSDGTNEIKQKVRMSGECGVFNTQLNFSPTIAIIDPDQWISDAQMLEFIEYDSIGTYEAEHALISVEVDSAVGNNRMWIRQTWVPADPWANKPANLHLSEEHNWDIRAIFADPDIRPDLTFYYNGSKNQSTGYFDNQLITNTEDSLVLLFRPNMRAEWKEVDSAVLSTGVPKLDGVGSFKLDNALPGYYCLAIYDHDKVDSANYTLPSNCGQILPPMYVTWPDSKDLKIYPNPSDQSFIMEGAQIGSLYEMYGIMGRLVKLGRVNSDKTQIITNDLESGQYYIRVKGEQQSSGKLMIIH